MCVISKAELLLFVFVNAKRGQQSTSPWGYPMSSRDANTERVKEVLSSRDIARNV